MVSTLVTCMVVTGMVVTGMVVTGMVVTNDGFPRFFHYDQHVYRLVW